MMLTGSIKDRYISLMLDASEAASASLLADVTARVGRKGAPTTQRRIEDSIAAGLLGRPSRAERSKALVWGPRSLNGIIFRSSC